MAIIGGVFAREFTKFNYFTGNTTLFLVHTHYFVLGMLFSLILVLLEKYYSFSNIKQKNYDDVSYWFKSYSNNDGY